MLGRSQHRCLALSLCTGLVLSTGCATRTTQNASLQFAPMAAPAVPVASLPQRQIAAPVVEQAQAQKRDVWTHLTSGYALKGSERAEPRKVAARHAAHPGATRHTLQRAEPYLWEIIEQVESRNIPLEVALLPAIETRFNPKARSPRGAAGLWQFLASTGKIYGLTQDSWQDGRLDTVNATRAALDYLSYLHGRYDDWLLALAAYNAGEGRVARAIEKNRKEGKPADYWNISLPEETKRYVPRLLGLAHFIKNADDYGFVLPKLADANSFTIVKLENQLDLTLAAELSGLPLNEILRHNPNYRHWTTAPDAPQQLILPNKEGKRLRTALIRLPADSWLTWERHRIKKGDTIGEIAEQYATTAVILNRINKLKGNYLRAGNTLLVPVPRHNDQLLAAGFKLPKALDKTLVASQDAPLATTQAAAVKVSATLTNKVSSHQIRYQIQAGDTLSEIAKAYNVSMNALAGWNNLKSDTVLRPGRMLTIWIGMKKAKAQTPA